MTTASLIAAACRPAPTVFESVLLRAAAASEALVERRIVRRSGRRRDDGDDALQTRGAAHRSGILPR